MEKGRWGKELNFTLTVLWLFSMALAGFFAPYFTDNIPLFKVKAVHVEGLRSIPLHIIIEEIRNLKNNWLFINKRILLENINKNTGNAVEDIEIDRVFASSGVELRINIKERTPFVSVIHGDRKVFFDEKGVVFNSPFINVAEPIVYTFDIDYIQRNFSKVRGLVVHLKEIKEVYITDISTIAYLKSGVRLILPPLTLLDESLLEKLKRVIGNYNIDMQVKELEINTDGLIIARGVKGGERD